MGIFTSLFGKTPEKHERLADRFFDRGEYGAAKIDYEKAVAKLPSQSPVDRNYLHTLNQKLQRAKESLARVHVQNGEDLVEANCPEDAAELFQLALELTMDDALKAETEILLQSLAARPLATPSESLEETVAPVAEAAEKEFLPDDDEDFNALLTVLPEEEQQAYIGYGEEFKSGYLALNRGDFETATAYLSCARDTHQDSNGYICLELATAHLNNGNSEEARSLLKMFLQAHPKSVRAYQLLCDIMWEDGDYPDALELLLTCPPDMSETIPIQLLQGETLDRSGKTIEAASLYRELLHTRGWDNHIAAALAGACERMGDIEDARNLYGEIMGTCQGCGNRVEPFIKYRFAETSLIAGDHSPGILELYLDLTREDPANQTDYYEKISQIYELQGNDKEARRFSSFARGIAP